MFRKVNFFNTFMSALIAAIVFIIPVYFFIRDGLYRESWLLYVGSFLFLVVMWVHTIRENKLRGENESTVTMVFISHVATISGIILASLFAGVTVVVMNLTRRFYSNHAHRRCTQAGLYATGTQ